MGGFRHLYLLVSNVEKLSFKAGKTIFLNAAMSRYVSILYFNVTGRPSYPAGVIVEQIML